MAAPAVARHFSYTFRDAKGQVARMRVLIGAATEGATMANEDALQALLQACSNAFVTKTTDATPNRTYGSATTFQDVEDKAILVFQNSSGSIHRYQLPAPLAEIFLPDTETADVADTPLAALVAGFGSYVYGDPRDTAALAWVGGTRIRKSMVRRFNIFTKNPALTGPGE